MNEPVTPARATHSLPLAVDPLDHALAVSEPRDKFFGLTAQADQGESCRAAGRGKRLTLRESGRAQGCPALFRNRDGREAALAKAERSVIWKAGQRPLFSSCNRFEDESPVKERGLFYSAHSGVKESTIAHFIRFPGESRGPSRRGRERVPRVVRRCDCFRSSDCQRNGSRLLPGQRDFLDAVEHSSRFFHTHPVRPSWPRSAFHEAGLEKS
jgi:hypothetical protein